MGADDHERRKQAVGGRRRQPRHDRIRLQRVGVVRVQRRSCRTFCNCGSEAVELGQELVHQGASLRLAQVPSARSQCVDRVVVVDNNCRDATAELAWGLLLCLARRITDEHNATRNGSWQETLGVEVNGMTLGVIGLGAGTAMLLIGRKRRAARTELEPAPGGMAVRF